MNQLSPIEIEQTIAATAERFSAVDWLKNAETKGYTFRATRCTGKPMIMSVLFPHPVAAGDYPEGYKTMMDEMERYPDRETQVATVLGERDGYRKWV